jgi:hypothetical protein
MSLRYISVVLELHGRSPVARFSMYIYTCLISCAHCGIYGSPIVLLTYLTSCSWWSHGCVHLSFVFLGFVIACFEQVLQVSKLLLSSCDDLLVVDEGCVVDCHVLRCVWLATGVRPWIHESIYFEFYLLAMGFCDGTNNFRRQVLSWASLLFGCCCSLVVFTSS